MNFKIQKLHQKNLQLKNQIQKKQQILSQKIQKLK